MSKKLSYKELEERVKELEKKVADHRQTKEAFIQVKEEWESTFNSVPDLIAILDNKHRMVRVNKAMADKLGVTPDDAAGLNCYEHVHGTEEPPPFCPHAKLLADGQEHFAEVNEKRLDGDFLVSVSPLHDIKGKLIGSVHVARDITSRKQAEKALAASEERFRELAELLPETIFEMDEKGHLTFVNRNAFGYFGYTQHDFDRGLIGFDMIFSEDRQNAMDDAMRILNGETIGLTEYTALRKDGSTFPALFHATAIIREEKPVGIRGCIIDISETRQLETQLQQSQKMESIGTLAGGIAHDFNNILGIIIGNTELALDDVPKYNPAHFNLEEIKTASLRAKDIVRKLLSFCRKTDQELKPIEIVPVTKNALKFLRSTIPTTIDIRQNILATDETILADPTQVNQVLMNLCVNSYHAMEQTGGVIEISMESIILDEEGVKSYPELNEGHYFKITVSDTGPGIDTEIIDQIFDPYFTTKGVGKGSGMGLAVVHGIVKNHNGAISVASEAGEGTTFTVLFPLAEGIPEVETFKTEELPLGNETILFVDDEKSIVNMSRRMLERLGYQVETKMNPVEALELFQSKSDQFNLVITDMTMPQMTGVKLSEKLMEIRSDIPVIICTGHSSLIDETKAKSMGIAAYVMKPIIKQEIANTIQRVLANKIGFVQGSLS